MRLGDKVFVIGPASYVGSQFEGQVCEVVNVDDNFIDDAQYSVKGRHPIRGMICLWHPASSVLFVDADGWIENTGVQPVADDVKVDTKWDEDYGDDELNNPASRWKWCKDQGITHWRFHQEATVEPAPLEPPRAMSLSEQVAAMEDNAAVLKLVIQALENENADLKSKLEAIRGLV